MSIPATHCTLATTAALIGLLIGPPAPAEELRFGIFVYADLCLERQSGDIAGSRITIFRYPDHEQVMFEDSEGALMWPLIGVPIIDDEALRFEVSGDGRTVTFDGRFNAEALSGRLSTRSRPVELRRVRDFSQPMMACREG